MHEIEPQDYWSTAYVGSSKLIFTVNTLIVTKEVPVEFMKLTLRL